MLQSIHAILHNILFLELHFYKGTVQYSILHIILILQCSCKQIYFQVFLFQNYKHPVSTCSAPCENFILHSTWRITILQSSIDCSQTTFSLHAPRLPAVYTPRVYNSTNPQEPFFLENMQILQEEARATFCSTRTRILPEEVLMLQASNGTVSSSMYIEITDILQ